MTAYTDLCIHFKPEYLHSHSAPVEILNTLVKTLPPPIYAVPRSYMTWQKPLS